MSKQSNVRKMRVSFDLDEVLFVSPKTHKTEPPPRFPFNQIYQERLRLGTPDLIHRLQSLGYDVWVYTSSFRSEKYIRRLFQHYGVHFDGIVNGDRHLAEVQRHSSTILPQKVPSRYQISLHVDDEAVHPGAVSSGFRHTFWTPRMITGRKRSLHGQTKSGRRRPDRPGHEPAATGN